MPEPVAQPNNQVGVVIENQGGGEQGTPMRQRLLNSDIGSHSAPPRVPGEPNYTHGRQQSGTVLMLKKEDNYWGKLSYVILIFPALLLNLSLILPFHLLVAPTIQIPLCCQFIEKLLRL
jgi:hypothetical protein